MIGHRLLGTTLLVLGDVAEGLVHLDRALTLYDPDAHRALATRFGHDVGAATLTFRPLALWLLGYPKTALAEIDSALKFSRETDHAPTLLFALSCGSFTYICGRHYAAVEAQLDECTALAEEKGAVFWKAFATAQRSCILTLTGKASDAVQTIDAGITGESICSVFVIIFGLGLRRTRTV